MSCSPKNIVGSACRIVVVFLIIFSESALQAQVDRQESSAEYQHRFERAVRLMFAGDYAKAAGQFELLFLETGSPRVRLEWARSLYLAGRYHEAEQLFRQALEINPPHEVREAITGYLRNIRSSSPHLDIAFNWISERNPLAVAGPQTVYLWGLPFQYQPAVDSGRQHGVGYSLLGVLPLTDSRWAFSLGISGVKFERSNFDRTVGDFGLEYRLVSTRDTRFRLGLETGIFDGARVYDYPSVTISQRFRFPVFTSTDVIHWRAQLGQLDYLRYSALGGAIIKLLGGLDVPLTRVSLVGLRLDTQSADIRDKSYASQTIGFTAVGITHFFQRDLRLFVSYGLAMQDYNAPLALFGTLREDRREITQLQLSLPGKRIQGFIPTLTLTDDRNKSNIPLFGFKRQAVNLGFNREF